TGIHAIQIGGASSGNLQIQSTGTIRLGDDFVQRANGSLSLELSASSLGHSIVQADAAQLDGILNIQLASGYTPSVGSEFHVLNTTSSVQGDFESVVLPTLTSGLAWDVSYTASSVSVRVVMQGDYNRDNRVDAADYILWRQMLN